MSIVDLRQMPESQLHLLQSLALDPKGRMHNLPPQDHTFSHRSHSSLVEQPRMLPLHRPPPPNANLRPHTVHATASSSRSTAFNPFQCIPMLPDSQFDDREDEDGKDHPAADLFLPGPPASSRPLQRLKSEIHLPSLASWPESTLHESARNLCKGRRMSCGRRLPTSMPMSNTAMTDSSYPSVSPSDLIKRRTSRSYKNGLRDGIKDIRERIRRSSTAQHTDLAVLSARPQAVSESVCSITTTAATSTSTSLDTSFDTSISSISNSGSSSSLNHSTVTVPQPTSPSKRNGKHGDDRPKKHIRNVLTSGDRKDTPAPPPAASSSQRVGSRPLHALLAVSGGERARQSAAAWKTTAPVSDLRWPSPDDLSSRRSCLGSLSSAADSAADLSSYAGSSRDYDADTEMCDPPAERVQDAFDFVELLPSEIALQIFECLDAQDLMNIEQVSKGWRLMAGQTSVWRLAFLRRYQRQIYTDPPPVQVGGAGCGLPNRPDQEWKKMYRARLELDKNWRRGPKNAGKAVYLAGHTDSVYCLQFDEEKIITGSRDRTIRVWDINNFTCKLVLGGPGVKPSPGPKVLRTVDYPDFHIATASVNGTAYGDSIFRVPSQWHDASILCLQYDDRILVTGSSDCDLLVWDVKTYEPIRRLRKHSGGVLDVALDAKHIVSCSKDSRIIVWDRETYEPRGELTGHLGPVNAVQLRGRLLASASGDGIARLWDIEEMKLVREFPQKERGLAAVEFSEDMCYVLAGGNDTVTYKFDVATGLEVQQFTGHTQLVRSLWLDGANGRVVTGSYDLDLRVYDFATGAQIWRAEEWTTSWMLAAKSDYRRIVATSQDGRLLIIDFGLYKGADIRDGQPLDDIDLLRGLEHTSAIKWTDPWERDREQQKKNGGRDAPRCRRSSVAADGVAPSRLFSDPLP